MEEENSYINDKIWKAICNNHFEEHSDFGKQLRKIGYKPNGDAWIEEIDNELIFYVTGDNGTQVISYENARYLMPHVFAMYELEGMSLPQLREIIYQAKEIYNEKFEKEYVTVEVFNNQGNISYQITKETGFKCNHFQESTVNTFTVGTNQIFIPCNEYTDELKYELKEKYSNAR